MAEGCDIMAEEKKKRAKRQTLRNKSTIAKVDQKLRNIKKNRGIRLVSTAHKGNCVFCKLDPTIRAKIEGLWVGWYTAGEILEQFPALVDPRGYENGCKGKVYKYFRSFELGLQKHAIWADWEERRMQNWRGANKQIIRLGQLDIRSLSSKQRNYLASKAIDAEAKMAAPANTAPAVTINFGDVSTLSLEEKAKQLLAEVTAEVEVIDDDPKQIENGGQTEDE